MRVIKAMAAILASVLALAIGRAAAAGAAVMVWGEEMLARLVRERTDLAAGQDLTLGGPVRIDWGRTTTLALPGVAVSNAPQEMHEDVGHRHTAGQGQPDAARRALQEAQGGRGHLDQGEEQGGEQAGKEHGALPGGGPRGNTAGRHPVTPPVATPRPGRGCRQGGICRRPNRERPRCMPAR